MNITENLEPPIGEYKLPDRLIKLIYSKHAKERLVERTTGSLILAPQYIRMTKDNTIDVKFKNGRMHQATVILPYKHNINICLPVIIYNGLVKTVYFEKKYNSSKKDNVLKEIQNTEVKGEEIRGESRIRENVELIPQYLGGEKKSRWQCLLSTFRSLAR